MKIQYGLILGMLVVNGCIDQRASIQETKATYLDEIALRQEMHDQSMELYEKALKEYKSSDCEKAVKLLKEALEKDDRNAEAWMQLGVIEYGKNHYYEAARAFTKVSRLLPTGYESYFNLGTVYETTSQFSDAMASYKKALELNPDDVEIMENLIRCYIRSNQNLDETKTLIHRVLATEYRPEWRKWLEKEALRLSLIKSTTQPQEENNAN